MPTITASPRRVQPPVKLARRSDGWPYSRIVPLIIDGFDQVLTVSRRRSG